MIKFACTCHAVLEVGDDFAGTSLQCPKCRRLVDVPTLSDLQSLTTDGTYKMDKSPVQVERDRLAKLERAFAKTRVDELGNQIDLRGAFGAGSQSLVDNEILDIVSEQPIQPKYDPETGELVRAVPLRNEPVKFDPNTIPMAKAVINYASGTTGKTFNGWRIWAEIFKFQNLAVMGMILILHIAFQLVMIPMLAGMFIVFFGPLALIISLVAHYANVVQDIGVENGDELSRPLRDLSWTDDIGGPFFNFTVAALVCYGPLVFWHRFPHGAGFAYTVTVLIFGTIFFPAVFLTTATSGTLMNLSPDRVLRVISAIGLRYLVAIGLWAVAAAVYAVGIFTSLAALIAWMTSMKVAGGQVPLLVSNGILAAGILLMHGFCWYLGLLYRGYYDQFNWLLQRHIKTIPTIKPPQGMTVATPAMAAPVAKAIAAPASQAAPRYPQSHA